MPCKLGGERLPMDDKAAFLLEVAIGPDVVVAGEEVHFHAHVGQFRQFAEKARIAFGHHISVFVPEVKHVAEQIHGLRLVLDAVEEAHKPALLHTAVRYGERPKMGVGKKIDVFFHRLCRWMMLFEAQFNLCFFAHHALIPCGFKHKVYVGGFHTVHAFEFRAYILEDEVGRRA